MAITASAQAPLPNPGSKILDPNRHLWVFYSGDHGIKGPWGVHFDAQWRRAEVGTQWQQWQARPGVNYEVSPNLLLTLGYVFTGTYPYGEFPVREAFPEHRIYQQALVRHRWNSLRVQHRMRLEQRWVRYPNLPEPPWTYQNRFRYLFRIEAPLTKKADGQPDWYIPVYDEILIGIPPNYGARPYDQNRIYAGIGKALPGMNVEAAYLNQFLGQRNGRVFEMNHTLVLSITSTVRLGR